MQLFKQLLMKRRGWISITIGVSIAAIIISLYWNYQLSCIINRMNERSEITPRIIITAVCTILLYSGISYLLGILSGWSCETMAHDLRMGCARYVTNLPLQEIEIRNAGEQISKLQNEVTMVSTFMNNNLFLMIDDLIRFIGTFSWLLWLNPKLTLLAYAPCIFLMWYTVYSSKIIGALSDESQKANASMNKYIDSMISLFPILRLFEAGKLICGEYNKALKEWATLRIREERIRAILMSLSGLMSFLPLLLLFIIGGTQVIHGEYSIGIIYIFINLSGNVSGVLMNMPGRLAEFRRFISNMNRLKPAVSFEPAVNED